MKIELDRKQIENMLQQLADSLAPEDLSLGAMCYDVALPPDRAEYVCPTCGEKTLYTNDLTEKIKYELPYYRELIESLTVKGLELDESEFCKKCGGPPSGASPAVRLIIHYAGNETPHCVRIETSEDLLLVVEFISGKRKHDLGMTGERPLKQYISRLEQLLGVRLGQ